MEYWEEQQLKQTGYFEEEQKTVPNPKFGEPALETTLNNVKKTLWDVERHTSETQSRLDKNNQSGPSHPLYKIAKWTANTWALDIITETLVEIRDELESSAIARHSKSPLETSLISLRDSTVSFNEKTERWHDDQTNLMVKGTDPRVAAAMKVKPEREAVEGEIHWGATIASILQDISADMKLVLDKLSGAVKKEKKVSAEDKMEGKVAGKKAAKEEKKQTGFLQGMWNNMKEKAKKSWFAENWKPILAGLLFLFAPLEWIKKLWSLVVGIYDFIMGKKTTKEDVDTQQAKVDALKKHKEEQGWDPLGWQQAKIDEEEAILAKLKKEKESGKRFGGMFGKGGFLEGFGMEIVLITAGLALFGPAILGVVGGLIAGYKMIKGGIGMVTGAFKGVKNFAKSFTRVKDPGKAHTQALKENAKRSKVAGTAGETGAKKTAEKVGTKGAEKAGTKAVTKTATKGTGKAVGKAVGKSLLKKIPGLGLLFGAGFAVSKAMAGDFTGAGMELASGAMSIVPGIGTAGSVAMDAAIMARDMGAMKSKEKEGKQLGDDLNKAYKEGEKEAAVDKQESDKATKITSAIERKKKKSDDYVAARDQGVKVEGEADSGFEGLSEKEQTKLFEFAKKQGVSEKQVRGGYFNYSEFLDRGSIHKDDIGYGGAEERARLRTGMDYKERREAFKEGGPAGPSQWSPFGHDKSAFKKRTSLGDRWRNFSNMMWGDGEDESVETGPSAPAVRKPARKSFHMKKKVSGLSVTSKMTKLWAEHKGIDITGAGKRAGKRKASIGLTKAMAMGKYEEAKGVLGDKLYAEMTRDATVDGSKLSAAVSPDKKSKFMNDINAKNRTLQDEKSGSPTVLNTTNAQSSSIKQGDLVTAMNSSVHAQKLVETNADS